LNVSRSSREVNNYERVGVLPEADREHGQRRYGPDTVRRLEVLEVAKRAGFTLDEARLLLERCDAGSPAFESLRELAARKLPDVDALIARAQTMRAWLLTATDCSCTTLDVCDLFAPDKQHPPEPEHTEPLHFTHVRRAAQPA
jgi:MerR family redox-sensitive transcriptional activator SoxR